MRIVILCYVVACIQAQLMSEIPHVTIVSNALWEFQRVEQWLKGKDKHIKFNTEINTNYYNQHNILKVMRNVVRIPSTYP